MSRLTDEQLMERLQQGQTEALDELYRRYAHKLYVFCHNATRSADPQRSEDLVQDVFLRVIKAAHTYNPGLASFRTWVFGIARNRCIDVMRRRNRLRFIPLAGRLRQDHTQQEPALEDVLADPGASAEEVLLRSSLVEAVRDCIGEIENQDERQAILLYHLADKVYREIGEILGKSTSMARNHVKAAQDRLRQCLERKGIHSAPR